MFLRELCLNNFRLFPFIKFEFGDELNVLSGMNGQGKTSVLEAIHYLALTRSFRVNDDSAAIRFNCDHFDINAQFFLNPAETNDVRIFYSHEQGKNFFINGKKVMTFMEVIGMIPCVVSTMDDLRLIFGAPADRRRFVDIMLAQTSALYLQNLKIYRRILQQRNALLNTTDRSAIRQHINSWNKQLINYGTQIINRRLDFVDFLNKNLADYYSGFTRQAEQVRVIYKTDLFLTDDSLDRKQIENLYGQRLEKLFAAECDKKTTLSGPHRDDLEFYRNNKSTRQFCSLGENKIFILCLKFCEWKYLRLNKGQKPLMLLDDVFAELDNDKSRQVLSFMQELGQVFITTTGQNDLLHDRTVKNYILNNREVHALQ
jgi:DNA replication and repair protein RecF